MIKALQYNVLLLIVSVALLACQKNTYELANEKKSSDAPEYTFEPELNDPGEN